LQREEARGVELNIQPRPPKSLQTNTTNTTKRK